MSMTTSAPTQPDHDDTPLDDVPAHQPERGSRWRFALAAFLCLVGMGVAGYLTWVHYAHAIPICTGGGGCEAVNASEYSTVGPIPVSLLGAGMYLSMLALSAAAWLRPSFAQGALLARFGLALAGVGYSAYLTYTALTIIRATCVWCLTSFAIVSALCLLSVWELLRPAPSD
ncbi:MAG: vitamin K epoxide reductase family protein [Chloroflexi bacterium]|nr:vitamin K epoxide reductase family protein [Chloroflexota bacterium]